MYDIQEAVTIEGTMGLVLFYSFRMDKGTNHVTDQSKYNLPFFPHIMTKTYYMTAQCLYSFYNNEGPLCLPSHI